MSPEQIAAWGVFARRVKDWNVARAIVRLRGHDGSLLAKAAAAEAERLRRRVWEDVGRLVELDVLPERFIVRGPRERGPGLQRILDALPGTSGEVARALNVPLGKVAPRLTQAWQDGRVQRERVPGGRVAYRYFVANGRADGASEPE